MKISTIALVLGSALITCSAGAGLAACSSSSATGEPSTGTDSGADTSTGTDGGMLQDSAPGTDSMTTGDTSTTADAACAPALHASSPDGGIYCPFSKDFTVDGGSYAYCTNGTQECCLSPSSDAGLSVCATTGNCATGFSPWECGGPEDCIDPANPVCCLTAGPTEMSTSCPGTDKTEGFDGTHCTTAAICTGQVEAGMYVDNQFVTCESTADCPAGKTCIAVKTTGTAIGVCQ
jgi:hypothetical protein